MSYDYEKVSCSKCKQVKECVSVWSNITPWLCESCCSDEGVHWTQEQEDEENEE